MRLLIVFSLIIAVQTLFGQTRWTNIYYPNEDTYGSFFVESYDHGYLLVGKYGHNAVPFNWLTKTDINGQMIWKKTIGLASSTLLIAHISTNSSGDIYGAGNTNHLDEYKDPFIIKLDACGEKEWCKIINIPGSNNFARSVETTEDGGCVALLYSSKYISEDRVCMARFSVEGEPLWYYCYNSSDSGIFNQSGQSIFQTIDKGLLITGSCYYPDPEDPTTGWLKPYYIKTDSNGVFEWETVVHKDVGGENGGTAWSTSINPSGSYYYSSISHFHSTYRAPALLVMDLEGNVINIHDLNSGYNNGGLSYATFISDTTLAASAGWGNIDDDHVGLAVILDTVGNIIKSETLVQDIYTKHMHVVYDNKLAYMYNTYQNDQFDVYLTKLNFELESDTFYSYPFKYDSLCTYPITNDTITQTGCDIIVGIGEEEMGRKGDKERMELYPNPASNEINCQLSNVDCQCIIDIYDMWGRKMDEFTIPKGQMETQINISAFPIGIYNAVLKSEQKILDRKKFVVQQN